MNILQHYPDVVNFLDDFIQQSGRSVIGKTFLLDAIRNEFPGWLESRENMHFVRLKPDSLLRQIIACYMNKRPDFERYGKANRAWQKRAAA